MIKPALLIRLLQQRLARNEAYLVPGHNTRLESLKLSYQNRSIHPDTVLGYELAVQEENQFLRAVLEDAKRP